MCLYIWLWIYKNHHFNPIHANLPSLYLLKTLENLWFSEVFRRYRNGTLAIVYNEMRLIQDCPHRHNIDPFLINDLFSYPLPPFYTSKILWVSGVFRGYRNRTLTRNGLNMMKAVTNELREIKISQKLTFNIFHTFFFLVLLLLTLNK